MTHNLKRDMPIGVVRDSVDSCLPLFLDPTVPRSAVWHLNDQDLTLLVLANRPTEISPRMAWPTQG